MVIFGISIIVRHVSGLLLHAPPPPHDPLKATFFCSFFCALSDETCCHCRKLNPKTEKFKMAAIQNAISYEIVYLLI